MTVPGGYQSLVSQLLLNDALSLCTHGKGAYIKLSHSCGKGNSTVLNINYHDIIHLDTSYSVKLKLQKLFTNISQLLTKGVNNGCLKAHKNN